MLNVSKLKESLIPLYQELIENVKDFNDKVFFCAQWGSNYPVEDNSGLLFIGRATNDWHGYSNDVNVLFGDGDGKIFNEDNQMTWLSECNVNSRYNPNRSAFWRIAKGICENIYPDDIDSWYSHIAYSNICKVAPEGGNPGSKMYSAQIICASKILQKELAHLSPKVVIMITGDDWSGDALRFLNNDIYPDVIKCIYWSSEYKCEVFKINNTYILHTEHPQGKGDEALINCLSNLVKELDDE